MQLNIKSIQETTLLTKSLLLGWIKNNLLKLVRD